MLSLVKFGEIIESTVIHQYILSGSPDEIAAFTASGDYRLTEILGTDATVQRVLVASSLDFETTVKKVEEANAVSAGTVPPRPARGAKQLDASVKPVSDSSAG